MFDPLLRFYFSQVLLHRGKFENDFDNYGVDIMVKYRDREPLQKLTAHHQVLVKHVSKHTLYQK